MEAALIARLHATQAIERHAFSALEQAMLSASLPSHKRVHRNEVVAHKDYKQE